jgi:hypothetical protein
MGRQSKAIQARLKNLHKHVTTQKKAYVEDVTNEEDTDYNPSILQKNMEQLSLALSYLLVYFYQICQT